MCEWEKNGGGEINATAVGKSVISRIKLEYSRTATEANNVGFISSPPSFSPFACFFSVLKLSDTMYSETRNKVQGSPDTTMPTPLHPCTVYTEYIHTHVPLGRTPNRGRA